MIRIFFAIALLIIAIFLNNPPVDKPVFSSVWCDYDVTGNKICKFRNIAVENGRFYFKFTNQSIITGLGDYKDFQNIQLSSVRNHNRFFANISMAVKNCPFVSKKVSVISRFKPDNIMHVIHDDLLPLFLTLEKICNADFEGCFINLFLTDNFPTPYHFLYQLFGEPIYQTDCLTYDEVHMGLNLQTVWYQYGFGGKSRGPVDQIFITRDIINRFRKFILSKLRINVEKTAHTIVILNRPQNRKILNVRKISETVKKTYKNSEILIINVTTTGTKDLMRILSVSDVLIGMHGAEMILALFLPENSTVVEIFPFGIPAETVSFLRPLATFSYKNWTNTDENLTVWHPEYPAHYGGFEKLTVSQITDIKRLKKIEKTVCCDDPAFLHFMYQDTIIGDDFENVFQSATFNSPLKTDWNFPDPPVGLVCSIKKAFLSIRWDSNFNFPESVVYNILVETGGKLTEFQTVEKSLKVEYLGGKASVWISAIFLYNNHTSRDSHVNCN